MWQSTACTTMGYQVVMKSCAHAQSRYAVILLSAAIPAKPKHCLPHQYRVFIPNIMASAWHVIISASAGVCLWISR